MNYQKNLWIVGLLFCAQQYALAQFVNPTPLYNSIYYSGIQAASNFVDIDNDGDLDILGADWFRVFLYENDGNLNFNYSIITFSRGDLALRIEELEYDDLNNDGLVDFVVMNQSQSNPRNPVIEVYLNTGNGTFYQTYELSNTLGDIESVHITDVDEDGFKDIVTTGAEVTWFKNNQGNSFSNEIILLDGIQFSHVSSVFDFDLDGDLDIVFSRFGLRTLINDGNESFTNGDTLEYTNLNFDYLKIEDLDGDGLKDIIAAQDESILWQRNLSNGQYTIPTLIYEFTCASLSVFSERNNQLVFSDIDNDGDKDIVVYSSCFTDGNQVIVLVNDGTQNYTEQVLSFNNLDLSIANDINIADINGDLLPDILLTLQGNGVSSIILYNQGNLQFDFDMISYRTTNILLDFEDFNNDGNDDLMFGAHGNFYWMQTDPVQSILNAPSLIVHDNSNSNSYFYSDYIDLNGDNNLDIISYQADQTLDLNVFYGDGSGNVEEELTINNSYDVRDVLKGMDFDFDGDNDIVIYDNSSQKIIALVNNLGDFSTSQILNPDISVSSDDISFGDIRQNNLVDLVLLGRDDNFNSNLYFVENYGGGSFQWNVIDSSVFTRFILVDDVTSAIGSEIVYLTSSKIVVAENVISGLNGQNLTELDYPTGVNSGNIKIAILGDYNNDLALDIILFNSDGFIYGYPNSPGFTVPSEVIGFYDDFSTTSFSRAFVRNVDNDPENELIMDDPFNQQALVFQSINMDLTNVNFVQGKVFFDQNSNGILDGFESGLEHQKVILDNGVELITDASGDYKYFNPEQGNRTIALLLDTTWELTSDDLSFNVDIPQPIYQEYNFGIKPINPEHNMSSSLSPLFFLCNTPVRFDLDYHNLGHYFESGTITLYFDSTISVNSTNPGYMAITDSSVTWNFEDLNPFSSGDIEIEFASIPETEVGNSFDFAIDINTFDLEGNSFENYTSEFEFLLLCSYDPNDKIVNPPGVSAEQLTLHDAEFKYTIRFQNTGNFPAQNVLLLDTIDTNLDLSTFTVLGSSHTVATSIDSQVVSFYFDDINLPDSMSNPEGSQGYVTYQIFPFDSLMDSTVISNTASIVFDSNPAIVTNTVFNTMVESILDIINPMAFCISNELDVYLDQSGIVGIDPMNFDNGSTDNFGIDQMMAIPSEFMCSAIGSNTVYLMVMDEAGNKDSCDAMVNVIDTIIPAASCIDISIVLEDGEEVSIDTLENWTASDNCEISNVEYSKTLFSIQDVGENSVTSQFEDGSGNITTCTFNVSIEVVSSSSALLDNDLEVSLSANPMINYSIISFSKTLTFSYDVILLNSIGQESRKYINLNEQQLTIEKGDLAAGIYFINILDSNKSESLAVFKLIVE